MSKYSSHELISSTPVCAEAWRVGPTGVPVPGKGVWGGEAINLAVFFACVKTMAACVLSMWLRLL